MQIKTCFNALLATAAATLIMATPAQATLQARDLNGDGVTDAFYDTTLNITWLRNANVNGLMDWLRATVWAAGYSIGSYSDWRLPTMVDTGTSGCNVSYAGGTDCGYNVQTTSGSTVYSEMASLWYDTLGNKAYCPPGDASCSGGPQSGWGLTNTGDFLNLQSNNYWSGLGAGSYTAGGHIATDAFIFNTLSGLQTATSEDNQFYALAVRPGDSGTPVNAVSPSYSLSPTSLNFGTVQTNATSTAQTIALTNAGNVALTVTEPVMTGTNPGDFLFSGNTCIGSIPVGQGCSLGIAFSPVATGNRTAQVQVSTTPVSTTKIIGLTGTGGEPVATSTKIDDKCAQANFVDFLLYPLRKNTCELIAFMRIWFAINAADASNTVLFNWLVAKNADNANAMLAFNDNIKLGLDVKAYLAGEPWDNDTYVAYLDLVHGAKTLLSIEKTIAGFLNFSSPALTFLAKIEPVVAILNISLNAYNDVAAGYIGDDPRTLLRLYIEERCGVATSGTCSQDNEGSYVAARGEFIDRDGNLINNKAEVIVCSKHPIKCNDPNAKRELINAYMNTLELQYQAYRLVGYPEGSPRIRQDLGKALVNTITAHATQ